jgi:hypothetical protein
MFRRRQEKLTERLWRYGDAHTHMRVAAAGLFSSRLYCLSQDAAVNALTRLRRPFCPSPRFRGPMAVVALILISLSIASSSIRRPLTALRLHPPLSKTTTSSGGIGQPAAAATPAATEPPGSPPPSPTAASPSPAAAPPPPPAAGEGSKAEGELVHSVIIDAGSTGSRVSVYTFRKQPPAAANTGTTNSSSTSNGTQLLLVGAGYHAVTPGLSSFAGDPEAAAESLEPLVAVAVKAVPESAQPVTGLSLKATAGLRLLPGDKADAILKVGGGWGWGVEVLVGGLDWRSVDQLTCYVISRVGCPCLNSALQSTPGGGGVSAPAPVQGSAGRGRHHGR